LKRVTAAVFVCADYAPDERGVWRAHPPAKNKTAALGDPLDVAPISPGNGVSIDLALAARRSSTALASAIMDSVKVAMA